MTTTSVFQKSYDFYKQLYINLRQIPKRDRFTWGERCETMSLDLLQSVTQANYAPRHKRLHTLHQASDIVDLLKIYLRLGSDLRIVDQKKYIARQSELQAIGKELGGWIKAS